MTPNATSCCTAPYRAPRRKLGSVLFCELRSEVVFNGLSAGRIAWPTTRKGRARPAYILCGDLVKAVKRESATAICYRWGVSPFTVWKWRQALDVPETNEGTSRLRSDYAQEPAAVAAREKASAKARDPERRAKIAAAKRGRPRPRHVIEAVIASHRGKALTEETRRKISKTHRRKGTRPPKAGRPWSAVEDALLGALPVAEVARRTGRTVLAVYCRRQKLRGLAEEEEPMSQACLRTRRLRRPLLVLGLVACLAGTAAWLLWPARPAKSESIGPPSWA